MRSDYASLHGVVPFIAPGRPAPTVFASAEEIIDEARNGRMFILVDDEDRENEGDLIIPAQMATPAAINFMARHGRGLICLALTGERTRQLGLGPMGGENGCRHGTAFTVSIEARTGVTTGISAADRARTIAVACDPANGAAELVSPGHVFPLAARAGGVLVRAGHTEAAVDVARLAGLMPAGVICEIMKDDGTMARLPDLAVFAAAHGLKLGTIRDLIAHRCRHDRSIERLSVEDFTSAAGDAWRLVRYRDPARPAGIDVLVKGPVGDDGAATIHYPLASLSDLLGIRAQDGAGLPAVMRGIAQRGRGVIILHPDDMVLRQQIVADLATIMPAQRWA